MKLAEYLAREGMSQKEFAKRAGLSEGTVSLIVREMVNLSAETLEKISAATAGEISEKDFTPLLYGKDFTPLLYGCAAE
jgi:transcriptional regulator with XRE-family HTH domain